MLEDKYYTLTISIHRFGESYQLEIAHSDPTSQARVAPRRGVAKFDLAELRALEAMQADYGRALAGQLFSDPKIEERLVQVETAAQSTNSVLRASLSIDPSAQELHALRWELLRHPRTDAVLAMSQTTLLSRFMVSRDWRPVKLRARSELRALVAISAPPAEELQRMGLAPVDFAGEFARVERALGSVRAQTLGGPDAPLTLDGLHEQLHEEFDVLYLVAHGMFGRRTGVPAVILQDEGGRAKAIKAEELALRISELRFPPRLVVLASCESGGDGSQGTTSLGATLAGRLADAGVPAIIAMQGQISMATIETMMPTFFDELMRDGQLDRALAVARGKVRDRPDAWMPALFTRLSSGRLWYTPGFRSVEGEQMWRRLLKPIREGKVVPILGPRLLEAAHGDTHDTAARLAGANHFPLASHEWDDLPRVTEYVSVKESRYNVVRAYQDQLLSDLIDQHRRWLPAEELPPLAKKPKFGKLLALVGDHLREHNQSDAYRILADLPASIYVTTNFDPLLERALRANERDPQQVLTRWRYERAPQSADEIEIEEPTPKHPLVYHAFGAFGADTDDGLVLTEDDYFDYLITTSAAQLLPAEIESALVDNSLLFLGFRLTDWHFRVLFRLMMNLPGRDRLKQYCHVAVQCDPDMQTMADVEGAKEYLAAYFGQEANIDIYWGNSEEFLAALHGALQSSGRLDFDDDPETEGDDEWNF